MIDLLLNANELLLDENSHKTNGKSKLLCFLTKVVNNLKKSENDLNLRILQYTPIIKTL